MGRKIILFELNEVPAKIVDCFCRWRPNSTFSHILPECHQYDTFAEDEGELSPWITWPTLHRGVSNSRHYIHDFGQNLSDVDREFPPIWHILTANGVSTGVCGSLHSYPLPKDLNNYSFYLPDTFATGSECFPQDLSIFQEFSLQAARESARNVSSKIPWAPALKFLLHAPGLGLKPKTFLDLGIQLADERVRSWTRTRRRTFQATLAFDVFDKYLKSTKPSFSTFFTNHVASSMHRYWAATFPDDYEDFGYDDQWVETYAKEIEFTMRKADEMFARLVRFVDNNTEYQLWMATSMGQAATTAQPIETQLYIRDCDAFMSQFDLDHHQWEARPAMLPRYGFRIVEDRIQHFRRKLETLAIEGKPVDFQEDVGGFFSVRFGQRNADDGLQISLNGDSFSLAKFGLQNVEIEDRSGCSAYHIPEGCLRIYDPTDKNVDPERSTISTADIAPVLLKNFSVPVPAYMNKLAALGGIAQYSSTI